MIQLLLHLWGDYCLQPGLWAVNKRKQFKYALLHSIQYGFVFWVMGLTPWFSCSFSALLIIVLTHAVIDRFYPSRYLIFIKNWIVEPNLKWEDCAATGYPASMPAWLAVWLMIVVDNTLHLTINAIALALL